MKIVNTFIIGLCILVLASCTSKTYLDARDKTDETIDLTTDLLTPAHVVVTDEPFIDTRPVFHKYHPAWIKRKLTITINEESTLDELMSILFKDNSRIKVILDDKIAKLSKTLKISPKTLNGTLVDIVEKICRELDIHYDISDYDLTLSEAETKILQLGVLPGSSAYNMGSPTGTYGNVEYSSPSKVDIWENLEKILDSYTTPSLGKALINKSSSTITVIDRPSVVKKITNFIDDYNKLNMQQVGIKIQVLEVELTEGFKRGIDWDLIRETLNTDLNINFDFKSPTNILSAITGSNLGAIDWKLVDPNDKYNGSGLLIQYIEEQGKVSIVSEPRFTVLNNQASELSIETNTSYVKRRTLTTGTATTPQQTGITDDELKTGFKLYILPTILDGEILLQITTSISRLVNLTGFGDDGSGNSLVQLPQVNDRKFTQRSVVPNNATLVLTGFKEQQAGNSDASPFKMNLLGGQVAAKKTTEIVILVTPVIIRG